MRSLTAFDDSASSLQRLVRGSMCVALAVITLGLCAWRLGCVRAGPDPDSDAYGHFLIARQLLATPFELRIHWVWLPLYHALLALPIALGATLDHVRQLNALAATLPPLFLLWALARERPSERSSEPAVAGARLPPVALGAALLAASAPLLVQLGTTGQMEVGFCALLTLVVALLVHERWAAAAVASSALALMRYEGWAVAAVVGVVLVGRGLLQKKRLRRAEWACVIAPGASVAGWATLRWLGGEPWFGFILENQAFAERALDGTAHARALPLTLARYIAVVPWRTFGLAALGALIGIRPTLRRHGVWLVAPGLALLAFLTASSLTRSQLGLDRHFMSVIPFAATWIAHGLAQVAKRVTSLTLPLLGSSRARWVGLLALVPFLVSAAQRLSDGLDGWLDTTRQGLREQREIARALRNAPPEAHILCGDASIEVLSELAPERFERLSVARQIAARVAQLAPNGDVYVVQRAGQLHAVGGGAVLYGDLDGPPESFVLMRFAATSAARHGG
jgi:hypothetical protein